MTCIVAVVTQGAIHMGADSSFANPEQVWARDEPKIFNKDGLLIGCAGSVRVGQLIEHSLVLPEHSKKKSDLAYLVTDVIDAIRLLLDDKGRDYKRELDPSFGMMVAYRGRLYEMYNDFQIGRVAMDYSAIGSGAAVAKGALCVLPAEAPILRMQRALEAAATHTPFVRAPWIFLQVATEATP